MNIKDLRQFVFNCIQEKYQNEIEYIIRLNEVSIAVIVGDELFMIDVYIDKDVYKL